MRGLSSSGLVLLSGLLLVSSAGTAHAQAGHRELHRVFAYVGFAPALVTRLVPSPDGGESEESVRFRQRTVTLGAAYRHHFLRWLGLHAGASVGVGRTHLGVGAEVDRCCAEDAQQVAPSFSFDVEAAALFGPFGRAFYLSPGPMVRVFLPLDGSATVDSERLDAPVEVRFPSPMTAAGARLSLGAMLGAHDEYDLGLGLDTAYVFGSPEAYFGLFARFGVAFGDLASD